MVLRAQAQETSWDEVMKMSQDVVEVEVAPWAEVQVYGVITLHLHVCGAGFESYTSRESCPWQSAVPAC